MLDDLPVGQHRGAWWQPGARRLIRAHPRHVLPELGVGRGGTASSSSAEGRGAAAVIGGATREIWLVEARGAAEGWQQLRGVRVVPLHERHDADRQRGRRGRRLRHLGEQGVHHHARLLGAEQRAGVQLDRREEAVAVTGGGSTAAQLVDGRGVQDLIAIARGEDHEETGDDARRNWGRVVDRRWRRRRGRGGLLPPLPILTFLLLFLLLLCVTLLPISQLGWGRRRWRWLRVLDPR